MPAGYGIHRDADGLLAWGDVARQLAAARNYWVASTRPDGRPHVAPVWGVWLDDTFYFSTDRAARKSRNLARDARVVVHLESGDEAAIVEGVAREVADPGTAQRVGDAYEAKYGLRPTGPEPAVSVLYGVAPEVVLAWSEQSFPATATRWRFARGSASTVA